MAYRKPKTEAARLARNAAKRESVRINAERIKADPSLSVHGLMSTYTNWGCKCDKCKAANKASNLAGRQRRKKILETNFNAVEHGKETTYLNWACRCADCTAAHTVAQVARDRRRKGKS